MKLFDAIGLSALNLWKDPVRSVLTILGLSVGIGAILTVWTLGGAGEAQVETEIARLGVDKLWVTARADSERTLTADDSALVSAATGAACCAGARSFTAVALEDTAALAQVFGQDAAAETVHDPVLLCGRFFRAGEHRDAACVAVVDKSLAEHLAGSMEAVLGRRLTVGARQLRVIGVVQDQTVQAFSACEGTCYLPLTTFADTFGSQVDELTVGVPRGADAEQLAQAAVAALSGEGGAFDAASLQEEIEAARSVIRIFVMVLACVAAVCMLVGGIGVMNILLVSVRERRREIGLLKAVGGTSGQVALLFLLEAAGYSLLGGVLGAVLGAAMIRLFGSWIGLNAVLDASRLWPVLLGAAVLGLLFGVLPALRAAGMMPVDALRQE